MFARAASEHLPVSQPSQFWSHLRSMVQFVSADRSRIVLSLLTLLPAYRLVFGSWPLQDGPREATALRF